MTMEHQGIANTSLSDMERVLQKLADTQHQLHQAQEQVNAFRLAETEYRSTIEALQQKLETLAKITPVKPGQDQDRDNNQLKVLEIELERTREQHATIVLDLRNEISALRKNCENRQNQWNSEKSILEVDLTQLRHAFVHCEKQYQFNLHQQNDLTEQYVQRSEDVIQVVQQKLICTSKTNEKLQHEILKLSLEKEQLQNKMMQMQKMYVKAQDTITEMSLSHAAVIKKQDNLISSLRKQLGRILKNPIVQSNVCSIKGDTVNAPILEEAALIREFNSNLFEKLASSEDEISTLKNQVHILEDQLFKSRQEVSNYVRRVKTGALIVEGDIHKTDWKSSNKIWSTPEETFLLLHKMELLLQETILENTQLMKEKNELGEKLMSLHNSLQNHS